MSGERVKEIDLLRWISILAVVVHHGLSQSRHSRETIEAVNSLRSMLGWCVPAFLSISGVFADRNQPLVRFLSSRALRLLVPFVCVSAISYVGMLVVSSFVDLAGATNAELDPHLFIVKLVFLSGYGPQMYFLPYLFLVAVICRGLFRWLGPGGTVLALAVILSWQCAAWVVPRGLLGPGLDKLVPFALCFALGRWLFPLVSSDPVGALVRTGVVTVAAAVASWTMAVVWPIDIVVPLWLFLLLRSTRMADLIPARILRLNSGAVFLWHAPILLMGTSVVLDRLGIRDGWNFASSCALVVPLSLAVNAAVGKMPGGRFLRI